MRPSQISLNFAIADQGGGLTCNAGSGRAHAYACAGARTGDSPMRLSKSQRLRAMEQMCGVINDDDAVDPKHYFYNKRKAKNRFRKTYQLCRQVANTLQLVLTDRDAGLDGLTIVDVIPAPDARRMLVILALSPDRITSGTQVDTIMQRLHRHIPRLRSEVAQSICRRKTPQLAFEITTR